MIPGLLQTEEYARLTLAGLTAGLSDHRIEAAAMPRISVEVVPFSAGPHPGLNGPFVIHEFPGTADGHVLYQERPQAEQIWRDAPELVTRYRETFDELRRLSLGPEGSLAFLNELADGLALPAAALA